MQFASVPRQKSNQGNSLVVGGTGFPGSRRGLPPDGGCANCTLFVQSPNGSWPHELSRKAASVPPDVISKAKRPLEDDPNVKKSQSLTCLQ
jgi:hypothetical protein